ncbi:RND transporter [Pseudonocardia bannensis]|uniref:RND transporter n=1 Tax=Pseudonocardia bannensis TaxID=630973 RepID=A0A848DBP4_9PSEU|nr:RND transporter [Pseudonocardia bannensis]NMH90237.1 RND transporter [Pseudonocardia bannensis]
MRMRLRGGRAVLVAVALVMLALVGVGIARLEVDAGTDSFLSPDDPSATSLQQVGSAFGGDPVVVLLETDRPGGLLSGEQVPALLELEGRLARLPDVAAVYGPATVLNQVAGRAQDLLAELSGYRDGLRAAAERRAADAGESPAQVASAGAQAVAGFDQRYGALLVQGLPAGLPTLRNERFIRTVVFDEAGEPRPQWRFVAPSGTAAAVLVRPRQDMDQAALENLVDAVTAEVGRADLNTTRVTVSGAPVIAAALGERVRAEVPLLGAIALLAVGAWFVAVRWTGLRRRLLPLAASAIGTAATLALYGWADRPLSLGVIAFLPVLIGVGSDFTTYLARRAPRRMVVVVALATAAGFGALAVSPVPTVRDLGITLAIGITLAAAAGMVLARRMPAEPAGPTPAAPPPGPAAAVGPRRWTRLGTAAVAGLLALTGWLVLPQVPLRADIESFAGGLPALEAARHVEEVIGSSGEFTIALSGADTTSPEALQWMRQAEDAVVTAHGDELRPAVSPPGLLRFLGTEPTPDQLDAALRLLPPYLTGSVLNPDRTLAVLTFGTRLDNAEAVRDLRADVERILPAAPAGMRVDVTGLPVVAAAAYEQISADRYLANLAGIAAAGLVLAVGLRRRRDAVPAVLAAVVATGLGLLGLWVTGIGLTPVTVALGSLTAAVGCEFTVLLAEAARRGDAGLRRAVLLAAAASATGYAVLMLSELTVVAEFGMLLMLSVGLAIGSAALVVWAGRASGPSDSLDPMPTAGTLVGAAECASRT